VVVVEAAVLVVVAPFAPGASPPSLGASLGVPAASVCISAVVSALCCIIRI
jgi:hypothetical protein